MEKFSNLKVDLKIVSEALDILECKLLIEKQSLFRTGAIEPSEKYISISNKINQLKIEKLSLELKIRTTETKLWKLERYSPIPSDKSASPMPDNDSSLSDITITYDAMTTLNIMDSDQQSVETPIPVTEMVASSKDDVFASWKLGFTWSFCSGIVDTSTLSQPIATNLSIFNKIPFSETTNYCEQEDVNEDDLNRGPV